MLIVIIDIILYADTIGYLISPQRKFLKRFGVIVTCLLMNNSFF